MKLRIIAVFEGTMPTVNAIEIQRLYRDRAEVGRIPAELGPLAGRHDLLALALPHGCWAFRPQNPARIIGAASAASTRACNDIGADVEEIDCGLASAPFTAESLFYETFPQTSDKEIRAILAAARRAGEPGGLP